VKLAVKVVPGASRNEITGWLGESLKVRVTAPPALGHANQAVVALLAERLHVARDRIQVVAGGGAPRKTVEIRGLEAAELGGRLTS